MPTAADRLEQLALAPHQQDVFALVQHLCFDSAETLLGRGLLAAGHTDKSIRWRPRIADYAYFVQAFASRLDIVGFAAFGVGEAKTTASALPDLRGPLLTRAEGLAVNLPQASSATPQQNRKVVVAIAPDGTIAVNRQPVVLDRLRAAVQTHLVAGERVLVAIAADETVDYGQVVAVMDRLRTLDGIQLGMATQRPR